MEHQIVRYRHEPKRRTLRVKRKFKLTPGVIRIELEGSDMQDFVSMSPDDHVKLFIQTEAGVERRDYTPRKFDPVAQTLTLDFVAHEAGPATNWAMGAVQGDALEVGGPRGSSVVPLTFDWWLLVGDETALPAIGRRLEEMPEAANVISVISVIDGQEEQDLVSRARLEEFWVHRPLECADDPAALISALEKITFPEGDGVVWIAAEAGVARAVRDYLVGVRKHPLTWTRAAGYWQKGVADASVKLDE